MKAYAAATAVTAALALLSTAGCSSDDQPAASDSVETGNGSAAAAPGFETVSTDHGSLQVPADWTRDDAKIGEFNVVNFVAYDDGQSVLYLNVGNGQAPPEGEAIDLSLAVVDGVHAPAADHLTGDRRTLDVPGAESAYVVEFSSSDGATRGVELMAVNADRETFTVVVSGSAEHWDEPTASHVIDSVTMG